MRIALSQNEKKDVGYLDHQWEMQFFELKKFKKQYGHCDVPAKSNDKRYYTLARWCGTQRRLRKFSPLKYRPDRLRKLNELGFCWNILDEKFERRFRQLKQYHKKHGHCNVRESENPELANWCGRVRYGRRTNNAGLTRERIARLDELGFAWYDLGKHDDELRWEQKFTLLKEYKKKHGHTNVSKPDNLGLAKWCTRQRQYRREKSGQLTRKRIKRLTDLGFAWHELRKEENESRWEEKFEQLKQFRKKYGHCNVSHSNRNIKNKRLARWIQIQRDYYKSKSNRITKERIKKLNSIGLSWINPETTEEAKRNKEKDMLNELKRLFKKLNRLPATNDINMYGKYSTSSYDRHFGGIIKAFRKAKL
ncbi:MAG: Helicase associated domain protein [Bacteroidia bacterium]